MLLRYGANANTKHIKSLGRPRHDGKAARAGIMLDRSVLLVALQGYSKNPRVYQLLLDHGADEAELLHMCCRGRLHDEVHSMLELGCKVVNTKSSDGLYPFEIVASEWSFASGTHETSLTTLFLLLCTDPPSWVPQK